MLLRRKEKLYCAFVDFTKTFDRVPLKEMFESMGSMEHLRELWVVDIVESAYAGA